MSRPSRAGPSAIRCLAIAGAFGALAWAGITLTREEGRIAALWLPNAMLFAFLVQPLKADARRLVPACFVANVAAALAIGDPPMLAIGLALANTVEVLIAVYLLRRFGLTSPDVTRLGELARLVVAGGLVAPLISASLATGVIGLSAGVLDPAVWRTWFAADALGMVIAAPVLLVLMRAKDRAIWNGATLPDAVATLLGVALVCAGLFAQTSYPLLFLAIPAVVLAAFRLGAGGASASVVLVAMISAVAMALDLGPITLVKGGTDAKLLVLQLFLGASFLSALPVAAAIAGQRRAAARLHDSEALRASITDNIREVVFRADRAGRWVFLNPEWERITGRRVAECLGRPVQDLIAAEDRVDCDTAFAELIAGDCDELEIRFRFVRADGRVRWAEALARRHIDASGSVLGSIGSIRDVTERVEQHAALAASERELRLLADHSNDMIVRIGLDGIRRYVSPASRKLLGYEPAELLGATPIAAIHHEDRARVERVCRGLLDGSTDPICTYRQRRRDGGYAWLEAAYQLVRDETGRPVEFIATVRDVSQRHEAERRAAEAAERLEESHRLLTLAGEIAHVGYWRIDLATGHASLSSETARILELPSGDQPMPEDVAKGYVPEDQPIVREALARAAEGHSFSYKARVALARGDIRVVRAEGRPERAPDGAVVGIFGIIQDESEQAAAQATLAESEARFRLLAENASDVVLRTDVAGCVSYISPSCFELSGYTPEELAGRSAAEFIHADDQALVHAAHVAIVTGAEPAATVEYRLRHKDGDWRWLESHMKGWGGPEALAGGVISAIRGIGRRKAMEAQLVSARDAAEAAARAKASFLANMSHEIRTPMNGVIGFTDLLLRSDLDADQRRYAKLVETSGRAMMSLLDDILDFSKIEEGKVDVVQERFDLAATLRFCAGLVGADAARKGVVLDLAIPADLPWVTGDPNRVQQIVLNLLSNAVKFTDRGYARLQIEHVAESGLASIIVEDSGCGVPHDRRTSVFEPFVQADASISRRYGGTGLGLAISRRLARLMGGDLWLDESFTPGARMVLTLPLPAAPDERKRSIAAADAAAAPPRRLRILLAEDVEINQALVEAMLSGEGHELLIADDGARAIQAFASDERIDLILMDVQMPGMDGIEATRRIRVSGPRGGAIPILALTANAFAADLAACRAAGMNEVVTKPIAREALLGAIARALGAEQGATSEVDPAVEALRGRYLAFRSQALAELEALTTKDQPGEDLRRELASLCHKLAGTAPMFGDTSLGELAREVEDEARAACSDGRTAEHVRTLAAAMRRAA